MQWPPTSGTVQCKNLAVSQLRLRQRPAIAVWSVIVKKLELVREEKLFRLIQGRSKESRLERLLDFPSARFMSSTILRPSAGSASRM